MNNNGGEEYLSPVKLIEDIECLYQIASGRRLNESEELTLI